MLSADRLVADLAAAQEAPSPVEDERGLGPAIRHGAKPGNALVHPWVAIAQQALDVDMTRKIHHLFGGPTRVKAARDCFVPEVVPAQCFYRNPIGPSRLYRAL